MKDPIIFIKHIEESIYYIESYLKGKSKNVFLEDNKLQDAVVRRLEIIGEAVKNLPVEYRAKNKKVPWKEIAATRDKLIHYYFGVDMDFAYGIVKTELPKLKKEILRIIKNEG